MVKFNIIRLTLMILHLILFIQCLALTNSIQMTRKVFIQVDLLYARVYTSEINKSLIFNMKSIFTYNVTLKRQNEYFYINKQTTRFSAIRSVKKSMRRLYVGITPSSNLFEICQLDFNSDIKSKLNLSTVINGSRVLFILKIIILNANPGLPYKFVLIGIEIFNRRGQINDSKISNVKINSKFNETNQINKFYHSNDPVYLKMTNVAFQPAIYVDISYNVVQIVKNPSKHIINTHSETKKIKILPKKYFIYRSRTDHFEFNAHFHVENEGYQSIFKNIFNTNNNTLAKFNMNGGLVCRNPTKRLTPKCLIENNLCTGSNICGKNGRCKLVSLFNEVYVKCRCNKSLFGERCQHEPRCNYCPKKNCKQYNVCGKCRKGYWGKNCQKLSCRNFKMCYNGGNCFVKNNKRICECKEGFIGKFCEFNCGDVCGNFQCNLFNMKIKMGKEKIKCIYEPKTLTISTFTITSIFIFFLLLFGAYKFLNLMKTKVNNRNKNNENDATLEDEYTFSDIIQENINVFAVNNINYAGEFPNRIVADNKTFKTVFGFSDSINDSHMDSYEYYSASDIYIKFSWTNDELD